MSVICALLSVMAIDKVKSRRSAAASSRPTRKLSVQRSDGNKPRQGAEPQGAVERLAALSSTASALGRARDLHPLLAEILDTVTRLFETDLAYIMLYDPTADELCVHAVHGTPPHFTAGIDHIKPNEGIAGRVFAGGKPLVLRDAATDPRVTRQAIKDLNVHALACVPLMASGVTIGVLVTATQDSSRELPGTVELLEIIGDLLGMAIVLVDARRWAHFSRVEHDHSSNC
jgi:GAF domain-containing protein